MPRTYRMRRPSSLKQYTLSLRIYAELQATTQATAHAPMSSARPR